MNEANGPAIEAIDLTKKFGNFTAVDGLSFTIKRGSIFGLLGANGAGKSTTIRMLCGLLRSSAGSATVAGHDINREPEKVKQNIGYMSQKFSLYKDLTVQENISFFGGIYGLSASKLGERMEWAIKAAGLEGRESLLTSELSGGWKQRLALGCAVLHLPQIVFLDEPTGGADPISRIQFWEVINRLADEGMTVLVTTHYLDEAEYCNQILLINAGRRIAMGSPMELKQNYIHTPILKVSCDDVMEGLALLQRQEWVREVCVFGTHLHVNCVASDPEESRHKIRRLLIEDGLKPQRIDRVVPSLEDVFIQLLEEPG